ncbi:portal protein [Chitinimonas sp. PSY-7]|uniref:portal protein n=1 Tax=Chitinimonas sp. PSY-7 TaxID=3459088 RepID=UPI00403FEDBA
MKELADDRLVNVRVSKRVDPIAAEAGRSFLGRSQEEAQKANDPLDSAAMQALFRRLVGYTRREMDLQTENRVQIAIDHDYYDHVQWTVEDAQTLQARGQLPAVYNKIATSVNWVLGTERRTRVDWKILPRNSDGAKAAERKTQYLKYIADVNKAGFERSQAFADAVKGGIGWVEDGGQNNADGEPLYSRYVPWREMLPDSAAKRHDMGDARYLIRQKWLDVDVAEQLNPSRTWVVHNAIRDSDALGSSSWFTDDFPDQDEEQGKLGDGVYARQRVRVFEVWYRVLSKVKKVFGGEFHGKEYDPNDAVMCAAVDGELCHIAEQQQMQMRVAVFTSAGLLYEGRSPYKHDRFPYTAFIAYRRDRDNTFYGLVRGVRDPQDAFNKRMSKALYVLSTNKVVMEKGAVNNIERLRDEMARPDGIIELEDGNLRFDLNVDRDLAAAHLKLAEIDARMVQDISGITDENLGRNSNARSGRAIEARQDQGGVATSELFDNFRLAMQLQGEIQLSLIEQFAPQNKQIRITNAKGGFEFQSINDGRSENDIVGTKADFVVSEQDYQATIRQAQVQMLFELAAKLPPDIAIGMLDLIIDLMDVPNKDELVQRVRKLTGQRDPDAEQTPDEVAEQQAQQQEQAEQQALAKRAAMAEVEQKEALAEQTRNAAQFQPVIDQLESLMKIQGKQYALAVDQLAAKFNAQLDSFKAAMRDHPSQTNTQRPTRRATKP